MTPEEQEKEKSFEEICEAYKNYNYASELSLVSIMLCILIYVFVFCGASGMFSRTQRSKRRGKGAGDCEEVWEYTPYYAQSELVIA